MDNRITKLNIFRPVILFTAIAIIIITVSIGMAFPFINPAHSSNNSASSGLDDGPKQPMGNGISVKNVSSVIVDNDNIKWFCTDAGIVSFDGKNWKLHDENNNLPDQDLKSIIYVVNPEGPELWIASPNGATTVSLPIGNQADAITLTPENSGILSKNVVSMAAGKNSIQWFGTDLGVSAVRGDNWLTPSYDLYYPEYIFEDYPITSMATNIEGDSLYVGTAGAGIARVYRDDVDGISGASVYAEWGPILLPSDNIRSIFIAPDGTKWFGTKRGIARHTGNETLENWTIYNKKDGLIHNFVQAISGDKKGNIWFGTKAGISVFNGSTWISYTTDNGLASNNILSIATDNDGIVWIGTDVGITCYEDNKFINY
ncbi:two-component regulator propeller domain-containing protein [Bacteroidota bacterium]